MPNSSLIKDDVISKINNNEEEIEDEKNHNHNEKIIKNKSSSSSSSSSSSITPLIDEELIEIIQKHGINRDKIISFTMNMYTKGISTNDISLWLNDLFRNDNKNFINHSLEVSKVKQELQREKQRQQNLEKELKDSQLLVKEKEKQISVLTGGFDFETYKKVHLSNKIKKVGSRGDLNDSNNGNECIICMENDQSYETSCGCKKICALCYYSLPFKQGGKRQCPNCLKLID